MSKEEAIVACVGIIGVASVVIAGAFMKSKEQKKMDEAKDAFTKSHKIDEMIDKASVENEKLPNAEDKAIAKEILVNASNALDSAKSLNSYKSCSENFLRLYSDLTEGDENKIQANLEYLKRKIEREEKAQAQAAADKVKKDLIDRPYQHDIDKIRAFTKVVEVIKPDAYTLGNVYRTAAKLVTKSDSSSGDSTDAPVEVAIQ